MSGDSNPDGNNVKLELDDNEEFNDLDTEIRRIFDLEETEGFLDTDNLRSWDFNIDGLYSIDEIVGKDASEFNMYQHVLLNISIFF